MDRIFSPKRFWKYFTYDLLNAKNTFGLSLLIYGCMPLICYLLVLFFKLIFEGDSTIETTSLSAITYMIAIVGTVLTFPRKAYGQLTDKRFGSSWILLPASVEEKGLSMLLISCVVLPVLLFLLLFASDGIIGLLVPSHTVLWENGQDILQSMTDSGVQFNMGAIGILNWTENMLIFLLGAICFKRGKIGKTFLCIFAVSIGLMILSSLIFGSTRLDIGTFFQDEELGPQRIQHIINVTLNVIYFGVIGGLLAGLYYRLRTIKH